MPDPQYPTLVEEAREFLRESSDAETENRVEQLEDLRFRFGDQWPAEIRSTRSIPGQQRPMLTINETDAYCRQVVNQMRQQRPSGKVHGVNNTSDKKMAEVFNGIGRHIEEQSDAANAYDLAAEFQVTMGVGYWRIRTDYIREDSFDQDIYIDQIENPFTVYLSQFSTKPDGSDNTKGLITDFISREAFKQEYPEADPCNWEATGDGDGEPDWSTQDSVRLAEFYKINFKKQDLILLSNGITVWEEDFDSQRVQLAMAQQGLRAINNRVSARRKVMWSKCSGAEVLEEKEIAGRYIPIVPCYGVNIVIDGKRKRFGMVRFARDPQMMVNYWKTSFTEYLAMSPKAKWLMAEGQDEGYENQFANANNSALPVLKYKPTDVEGQPAPAPQRIQPDAPPAGLLEGIIGASQDLQRVLGMFDPVNLKHTGPKSGEAVRAEQGQSEQGNYHFYDNQCRSIKHTWRIILDLCPHVYDTKRTLRIIGIDGQPDLITVNEKQTVDGVEKILLDTSVGQYDLVMDTGPGYSTKQKEGLEAMLNLLGVPVMGEQVGKVGADLVARAIDAPFMDELADRLAAANPLSQVDKNSDIPPPVQMLIKQLQQQIQQLNQQLGAAQLELKTKGQIEGMKQAAATHREEIKAAANAASDRIWAAEESRQVDAIERTAHHKMASDTAKAQMVEEIKAFTALLLNGLDNAARKAEQEAEIEKGAAERAATE